MRTKIFLIVSLLFFSISSWSRTTIKLEAVENFSVSERVRLERIISNIEDIINSEIFAQSVRSYSYKEKLEFADNGNKSNELVLKSFLDGAELPGNCADKTWNLHLRLKFQFWIFSKVTAFTSSDTPFITIYSRYYSRASDEEVAGTICHEYGHKLGFKHDVKDTPSRAYSVPYAVGDLCTMLYVNHRNVLNVK